MRCRYCGSESIHEGTEHRNFSAGKAAAGAVVFGVVGVAAGLSGKEQKGYRCAACGAFAEAPMDSTTEMSIHMAISNAEHGGDRSMYDYYKSQYCNIQANIPAPKPEAQPVYIPAPAVAPVSTPDEQETVKHGYRNLAWIPSCPVFVEGITIVTKGAEDMLRLSIRNVSSQVVRSAYLKARVLDDTGDLISEQQCVYQGISIFSFVLRSHRPDQMPSMRPGLLSLALNHIAKDKPTPPDTGHTSGLLHLRFWCHPCCDADQPF